MSTPIYNDSAYPVDRRALTVLCRRIRAYVGDAPPSVSVACVDDATMTRLHERYYGESGSTDVLAFPYDDLDAEIVINPAYVHEDPAVHTRERFVELLVHGLLHLAGFDHTHPDDAGAHRNRQKAIMRRLRSVGLPVVIGTPGAFESGGTDGV